MCLNHNVVISYVLLNNSLNIFAWKSKKTYSVVAHSSISSLGGLARCRRGRGTLILGISALAGGGLSLRHVDGVLESLWVRVEG